MARERTIRDLWDLIGARRRLPTGRMSQLLEILWI